MKQTTTPDEDSVEMQNEQVEREMQTKASSHSTDRVPKDIQAVVAEIQQKQDGRRAETQADADYIADIDTLLQIINSTTQATSGSEPNLSPDEVKK